MELIPPTSQGSEVLQTSESSTNRAQHTTGTTEFMAILVIGSATPILSSVMDNPKGSSDVKLRQRIYAISPDPEGQEGSHRLTCLTLEP